MRVKPRALCRGSYFSQKNKPTSLQSHPGCKVSGSRLYRARRHFPGGLDSREADRKAGLHKHSIASGLKIRANVLRSNSPGPWRGWATLF